MSPEITLKLYVGIICIVTTMGDDKPHMHRTVNKNGLHRNLQTRIKIAKTLISNSSGCVFLLKEDLPSGLYVDYFELKMEAKRSDVKQQVMSPMIDTEKPEYLSDPFELSIITPELRSHGDAMVTEVSLPIHLRYHAPGDDQHKSASILIPNPKLLLHCQDPKAIACTDNVCKSSDITCYGDNDQFCRWKALDYASVADQIHLTFPVGNSSHQNMVVTLTFTSVISCLILILQNLYYAYKRNPYYQCGFPN